MKRMVRRIVLTGMLLTGLLLGVGQAAEMKVMHTQKAKDIAVTLLSESGQWTQGKNSFVLAFTSADTKQPVDVGNVTLSTSMPMPGMAPMLAGATLTPGQGAGALSRDDQLS